MQKHYYKNNNETTWTDKGYKFEDNGIFRNENDAIFHANTLENNNKHVVILGFSLGGILIYKVGYK